ncbi:MAG TPA: hypothetical protein VFR62_12720 [Gemmatimonadales bacterium]|nr:hypothetical protein [Gemmatimonadales bacterium]
MQSNERLRRLTRLVPWPTLLLAAACGGDKGPSGPGGDMEPITYDLVSLGRMGLPADAQLEDCTVTRFYSGGLRVTDDGSWEVRLQVHDVDGDWGYLDNGEVEEDGGAFWFVSDVSGSVYQGTLDGAEATIMYDWCYNGVPDVQLVFDR